MLAFHGHGSDRWQFIKDARGECRGVRDVAARFGLILISPDYRAKTSWMGPKAEADVLQIGGRQGMRKRHKVAGEYKSFNENLNPLKGFLHSKLGKKWDKTWDPEGLLSTLPAIATCLLGVLAGLLLRNPRVDDRRKVAWLVAGGAISVAVGFAWGAQFPVVKKIWTSSFVLVAGGYSALLLGMFYYVVDVLKYQRWCQVFLWYGLNPITVYLADSLVGFRKVASRFLGGDVKLFLDAHVMAGFGDLMLSFGEIGVGLALVWFLYRRKLFLRL